ncbi:reverse transcriptase domain, reverse transcriptase zinc-binding domain protein, partial [Tanacetum coccineum]
FSFGQTESNLSRATNVAREKFVARSKFSCSVAQAHLSEQLDSWECTLNNSRSFTVQGMRSHITSLSNLPVGHPTRWNKGLPIKININTWRVSNGRLPTRSNLDLRAVPIKVNIHAGKVKLDILPTRLNISKRGMDIESILCPLCEKNVEPSSHIFFTCPISREILRKVLLWWEIDVVMVSSYDEWLEWLLSIRSKAIHRDHQDTAHYIPMHHRTKGLLDADRAIFKNLERRFFHVGRVVHPSFLDDSNIPQVFSAINFDCLLNIDQEICPLFVLEFYNSVPITRNVDQTISIAFIIRNLEIVLPLHRFAQVLRVLCEGACMFIVEWSIASLLKNIDPNPIYHTPLNDPVLVRMKDPLLSASKKGEMIVSDPFQMELSEIKLDITILSKNTISLTGNKDHPNACLVYMLCFLATQKPFNIAYYMTKRMVGVIKNGVMVWICQISQEISQKRTRERMSDQEAKDLKDEAREIMPQLNHSQSQSPTPLIITPGAEIAIYKS